MTFGSFSSTVNMLGPIHFCILHKRAQITYKCVIISEKNTYSSVSSRVLFLSMPEVQTSTEPAAENEQLISKQFYLFVQS